MKEYSNEFTAFRDTLAITEGRIRSTNIRPADKAAVFKELYDLQVKLQPHEITSNMLERMSWVREHLLG